MRPMPLVLALLGALRAALRSRTDLALENLALRQQLALLRRRSKRPQFGHLDRRLWVWLSNHWTGWRKALHLVPPRDRDSLAPAGLPRFLDLEVPPLASGSPAGRLGACESRTHHGARESPLGRAPHSRRASQARPRRLAADRCPAHAASPEATFSDLANVLSEPPRRPRLRRLLRRADRDLPGALRIRGAAASSLQDRAADRRGRSPMTRRRATYSVIATAFTAPSFGDG